MDSYVKLNFKASLFSCIFWFEDSLLCKIAFLVVPFLLIFCEIEHWKKRPYVDCMTVIKKFSFDFRSRHLPDTLRHHPDTARHPQTPSRHPSDTPIFGLHAATGRKSNIWLSWYLFNWFQFLRHPHTPDICLTHSDTIQTLPDALRHDPDTPQKPPYLTGERVISEYHDIYSTVFIFSDNCFTQTSVRHSQTLSRNCQTPSTPSRHPSNAPILL